MGLRLGRALGRVLLNERKRPLCDMSRLQHLNASATPRRVSSPLKRKPEFRMVAAPSRWSWRDSDQCPLPAQQERVPWTRRKRPGSPGLGAAYYCGMTQPSPAVPSPHRLSNPRKSVSFSVLDLLLLRLSDLSFLPILSATLRTDDLGLSNTPPPSPPLESTPNRSLWGPSPLCNSTCRGGGRGGDFKPG